MPNETQNTVAPDPNAPHPDVKPIQVTNADAIFKEASKHLRWQEPAPKVEEPEADAAPPPPATRRPEKKPKAEPAPEPTPPAKSKREQFREAADAEKAYREKEAKLKEREATIQAIEDRFKDWQMDPIAYLEKTNPRAYEEWTLRNVKDGKNPDTAKIAALEKQISDLTAAINGTKETTQQAISSAKYQNYMAESKSILNSADFAPVHESIAIFEEVLGRPVDVEQAIASIWAEYHQQWGKTLTPREACEILLEDAQTHIDKIRKAERVKKLFGPPEKPKRERTQQTPGRTITSSLEQAGTPAREPDLSGIKNRDQLLAEAAKLLEYKQPSDE